MTVAGSSNGAAGSGNDRLNGPLDIFLSSNGTLFVAEWNNNRVQAFAPNSKIGTTVISSIGHPQGLFIDNLSNLYVTTGTDCQVVIQPNGLRIPPSKLTTCTWSTSLSDAYGVAVDRSGNIYVSSSSCSYITRWNVNSTNATLLIASSSVTSSFRHIYLDEDNATVYVADKLNHRILKIFLNSSLTTQNVAGVQGSAGNTADKLNSPAGVYVSQIDGAIYVADTGNNRVQKWAAGASNGTTVAGSSVGGTTYALNQPYAVLLDPIEKFLYVADYGNNRVQRFLLP